SSTGLISGTPTNAGNFTFTFVVKDAAAATISKGFTLTINSTAPPLNITTASPLVSGTVGTAYSQTLAATGGTAPYAWSVIRSCPTRRPSEHSSTGLISGTPTNAGNFTFTFVVKDAAAATISKGFTLTINSTAPPLSITTASPLVSGTVGTAYS